MNTDDKTLDMLADRIAEGMMRRGMCERHHGPNLSDTLGAQRGRAEEFDYYPDAPLSESGPLANVLAHIEQQAYGMREIAAKLNAHADRVHGHQPEPATRGERAVPSTKGMPAMQAVFHALTELDSVLSDVATAAGRNTTLA